MLPADSDPKLLEAARRAFERHGYAAATIGRIATEAGLSRVTLHRRGVTKDGLLAELVTRTTATYREAMWPVLVADGTAAERMRLALVTLCEVAEQHMGLLVALRAQSDRIFHRPDEEEALTRTVFTDPLESLLRDGASDGSLRSTNPLEEATVLFNLVGWTYIHMRTGHGWRPERARDAVLNLVLKGLCASGTRDLAETE